MIDGSLVNLSPPSIKKIEVSFFPCARVALLKPLIRSTPKFLNLCAPKIFFCSHFQQGPYPYCTVVRALVLHCTCMVTWSQVTGTVQHTLKTRG